jgi:hypothetical protein
MPPEERDAAAARLAPAMLPLPTGPQASGFAGM